VASRPGATLEAGIAQAMIAVLASPRFLYREEATAPLRPGQSHPAVDEYTLASRLSYFLWSSLPDDRLFRLARRGRLRQSLDAELDRMLASPRSEEFVRNFAGQWLQARDIVEVDVDAQAVYLREHPDAEVEEARETFRRLSRIPTDRRSAQDEADWERARAKYRAFLRTPKPALTPSLRAAMRRETELTFAHVLHEDRSLLELVDSDYTFLNEELAAHYGIPGVKGPELRKITLPPGSPRGGVLTQGTVLAVTSNPTRTSPVKRGVFVLNAILGTPPPAPPPDVPSLEDAAAREGAPPRSLRESLDLHASQAACRSCHNRMDPLGLAFENFNALGMWRETDLGVAIDPAGRLVTGERFADVRELKRVLATARRRDYFQNVAEKILVYALGRELQATDVPTVDGLVAVLESTGGRPRPLLRAIVHSVPFQHRRKQPPSEAQQASGRGYEAPAPVRPEPGRAVSATVP
jgi:hypothetical protein